MNFVNQDKLRELILKQPYSMTVSRTNFNTCETRLMLCIIQALQPEIKRSWIQKEKRYKYPFEVRKTNLGDWDITFDCKGIIEPRRYKELRKSIDKLTKNAVNFNYVGDDGKRKEVFTHLIMAGELEENSSIVTLKLHKEVGNQLVGLGKTYTRYFNQFAYQSTSPRTTKLYWQVCHFRDLAKTGELLIFNIGTLKKLLCIEDKYKTASQFKRRVLDPVAKELEKKSDIYFKIVDRIVQGKKMLGWKAKIIDKNLKKEEKKKEEQTGNKKSAAKQIEVTKAKTRRKEEIKAQMEALRKEKEEIEKEEREEAKDLKQTSNKNKIESLSSEEIDAQIRALQMQKEEVKAEEENKKLIKKYVKVHGLTRQEAIKLLEKSTTYEPIKLMHKLKVKIEAGEINNPRAYTIQALSKQLDIEL